MSDKNLRTQLIRLAQQKPELRADLLPLLTSKTASRYGDWGYEANEFARILDKLSDIPRLSDVRANAKVLRETSEDLGRMAIHLDKVSQEDWDSAMFGYFVKAKKLFMK